MQLVGFRVAGSGGGQVHINPEQVVCLLEAGAGRTQIVTTGLSEKQSITLIVEGLPSAVAELLHAASLNGRGPKRAEAVGSQAGIDLVPAWSADVAGVATIHAVRPAAEDSMHGKRARLSLIAGFALASLAPARAADVPVRRSGLWETNMKVPMGMNLTAQACVDGSKDKPEAIVANPSRPAQCDMGSASPIADGFHFHTVCHPSANMTMTSDIDVTGDFQTAYMVDSTTTMTPAPQGMPPVTMTVSGRYLGACPADMQAGDVKMNGRVMHPAIPKA